MPDTDGFTNGKGVTHIPNYSLVDATRILLQKGRGLSRGYNRKNALVVIVAGYVTLETIQKSRPELGIVRMTWQPDQGDFAGPSHG